MTTTNGCGRAEVVAVISKNPWDIRQFIEAETDSGCHPGL
jgi:hypothetical protein